MVEARDLRIAIVGCGAVSELIGHVPALSALGLRPAALVDPNSARTEVVAAVAGPGPEIKRAERVRFIFDSVDAAIVAVPHHLHESLCTQLLARGIHLLIEKPLAPTIAGCRTILAAARASGALCAVGLNRRFLHAARWAKRVIDAGALGAVRRFDVRHGHIYSWPVASSFFFIREAAGGGVLVDAGAHMLDLARWWLGPVSGLAYRDDDHGGVEADCEVGVRLACGAEGFFELSRTRELRNTAILEGDAARLEIGLDRNILHAEPASLLDLRFDGLTGRSLPGQRFQDLFRAQLANWLAAIAGREELLAPAEDGLHAVALIERCYAVGTQELELPWLAPTKRAVSSGT